LRFISTTCWTGPKRFNAPQAFFIEAARILPQDPPLIGNINWDALTDSLWGGLAELGKERVALIWTNAQRMLEHGLQDLLIANGCFEHIASTMATTKYGISRPIMLVVFLVGEGNNFGPFLADKVLVH
ncbi:MAG: hypothetical protein DMF75_16190, partial [Acidobacteria bacterium]